MKKLFYVLVSFSILFIASANQNAGAQIARSQTVTKASLSSTDTAYALSGIITSDYKSIEIGATKTSGSVAGKVYLQGKTLDGSAYVNLDSMTVANADGLQYKIIAMPAQLIYADYRLQFLSTGGVWKPSAYTLRRN